MAWGKLRQDYRQFRLDRIKNLIVNAEKFLVDDNINLENYLAIIRLFYGEDC
ncbi:WYL domain-containing protein [Colwelliaceae bacterium MEBiC 14330]